MAIQVSSLTERVFRFHANVGTARRLPCQAATARTHTHSGTAAELCSRVYCADNCAWYYVGHITNHHTNIRMSNLSTLQTCRIQGVCEIYSFP